jgi:hypothetical protein
MKNYLIGTLAVIIVFLASFIYKQHKSMVFTHFPVKEEMKAQSSKVPLYLFLFFSKKNCPTCYEEIVNVLNGLTSPFYVVGVVPGDELEDEVGLRRITGATFPLSSSKKYGKYVPWYIPTLIGVSSSGKVVFVLPEAAVQSRHLENFLTSAYSKLYKVLEREKKAQSN